MCILLPVALTAAADDGSFLISYYCSPPADREPDAAYAEVAECGFTHALPPCSPVTTEQQKAILDACAKHGVKYMVRDPRLDSDPSTPEGAKQFDSLIADFAKHPALGGYYVVDEPTAGRFPWVAAVNSYLMKNDPTRLPYINLLPNYASPGMLGTPTYEEYVDLCCRTVKPKLLSYDHYTAMLGDPENPVIAGYFQNLEVVRAAGLKYKIPTCYVMLSLPHMAFRNPTEADLRWQIWNSLSYGFQAIVYFTYWTPPDADQDWIKSLIDLKGRRTPLYNQVKRINSELKILGPTLMKLTSTGVYHAGTVPEGCRAQIDGLPVRVTNGAEVVLGLFKHRDGSSWAMVSNRLMRKPVKVEMSLDGSVKRLQELSAVTGVRVDLRPDESGSASFELRPGEGRLYKLIR